jgi:hypothetical protein
VGEDRGEQRRGRNKKVEFRKEASEMVLFSDRGKKELHEPCRESATTLGGLDMLSTVR